MWNTLPLEIQYCQCSLFKFKPSWTYLSIIFAHKVSSVQKLPLKTSNCFRTLLVSVHFQTINICSSTENCGLRFASAIFIWFFCFLFHSKPDLLRISSFGIKRPAKWLVIPLFKWLTSKIYFRACSRKWPKVFYAYFFNNA